MLKSLYAIAEISAAVQPVGTGFETEGAPSETRPGVNGYVPGIVVLLTDGASNRGIEPLDAVPYAVARRSARLHDRIRDDQPGGDVVHA